MVTFSSSIQRSHTAAVGVFNGCNYIDPTTGKPTFSNYYPGSVNITQGKIVADVLDDPNQLFVIQADEDVVQADFGKNADVTVGTGSTTTGVSAMELDSSTIATTAALNLKLVAKWDVPSNELEVTLLKLLLKLTNTCTVVLVLQVNKGVRQWRFLDHN